MPFSPSEVYYLQRVASHTVEGDGERTVVGTTISHYKVLENIGQGGMGEVYRAEDTNLSREVAIKVLPEQFTRDPQGLARFEREAKLLASLNHSNIAAIYGLEEADGVRQGNPYPKLI